MAEREILSTVEQDGEVLGLLDGRKLRVDVKNLPTTVKWLPMQELEISEDSDDPLYNLKVFNLEKDEEVLAVWL